MPELLCAPATHKLRAAIFPRECDDESGQPETGGSRRSNRKEQAPEGDGADGPCLVLHCRYCRVALGRKRSQSWSKRGLDLDNCFFESVCSALWCCNRAFFQVSRRRRHLCLVKASLWRLPRLYDGLDLLDEQYCLLSGAVVLRRK